MSGFGGQSSGDFRLSQGALRIVYSLVKDSTNVLTSDAFTQNNPNVVTAANAVSQVLPVNVKKGVLGGSVAFLRPDFGGNFIGGAVVNGGVYPVGTRPLGLFINDALGNAFENTPGPASGKGPYLRGGTAGVKIYETQQQTAGGAGVGATLTYNVGDRLYASVNGLLTNRWQDSYEAQWITTNNLGGATSTGAAAEYDITRMGNVISPPDATLLELLVELAFI
jgi:hypothetical protein